MRSAPDFWWRSGSSLAWVLSPLAFFYRTYAAYRLRKSPKFKAPVPVICVGNLVVGGAGKTPTVMALVEAARAAGRKPGILSRGYGGRLRGPVSVDLDRHNAADVGDEPMLLAKVAPTVVCANRATGARHALNHHDIDLLIMDDGLQNPRLGKDLNVVVVDGEQGVGNGFCLPAGPLRAPLGRQLAITGFLLVIGTGNAGKNVIRAAARQGRSVLHGELVADPAANVGGSVVLAFAGIGRPQKFFSSLRQVGAKVDAQRAFPDHHVFTAQEAHELMVAAADGDLRLITTAKDMARMGASSVDAVHRLAERTDVLNVNLRFRDEHSPKLIIDRAIAAFKSS